MSNDGNRGKWCGEYIFENGGMVGNRDTGRCRWVMVVLVGRVANGGWEWWVLGMVLGGGIGGNGRQWREWYAMVGMVGIGHGGQGGQGWVMVGMAGRVADGSQRWVRWWVLVEKGQSWVAVRKVGIVGIMSVMVEC